MRCALLLQVIVKPLRLRLGRIEEELRDIQRHFASINAVLRSRRDDFTDTVRQNMLAAYGFLDAIVHDGVDLFSDQGLEALLQLNHLVLLGKDYDSRAFSRHIFATRQQFFTNLSVAVEKGTKMAAMAATGSPSFLLEPFPLHCDCVTNGPERSRARRCWARRSEPLTARTVLRASPKRERRSVQGSPSGSQEWLLPDRHRHQLP